MEHTSTPSRLRLNRAAAAVPPHLWFGVSAVFHYLGPAFAVLLFPAVGVLGVAWLRIASAAAVFAPITQPVRTLRKQGRRSRLLLWSLGACLACMNCAFYLALDRLPMSLVAAMEFVGSIGVALYGLRTRRNWAALVLTATGVYLLIDVEGSRDIAGLAWATLNAVLFVTYILLAHRAAASGASDGVHRLGAAMLVAFVVVSPIGFGEAVHAFSSPILIAAGIGVGICSSVIPYVCDQLAMSRLPRESFALLLSLLPATAAIIGAAVLSQVPTPIEMSGIAVVMLGIAIHKPAN